MNLSSLYRWRRKRVGNNHWVQRDLLRLRRILFNFFIVCENFMCKQRQVLSCIRFTGEIEWSTFEIRMQLVKFQKKLNEFLGAILHISKIWITVGESCTNRLIKVDYIIVICPRFLTFSDLIIILLIGRLTRFSHSHILALSKVRSLRINPS